MRGLRPWLRRNPGSAGVPPASDPDMRAGRPRSQERPNCAASARLVTAPTGTVSMRESLDETGDLQLLVSPVWQRAGRGSKTGFRGAGRAVRGMGAGWDRAAGGAFREHGAGGTARAEAAGAAAWCGAGCGVGAPQLRDAGPPEAAAGDRQALPVDGRGVRAGRPGGSRLWRPG